MYGSALRHFIPAVGVALPSSATNVNLNSYGRNGLNGSLWRVLVGAMVSGRIVLTQRVAGHDNPVAEGECPDWESLPLPPDARLVLCVPGDRVRIHTVSIPTRNRRRFLAALPFALEDQLFYPPETYHLVPLPPSAGGPSTSIAVVEHARLVSWGEAVGKAGLVP